MGIFFIPAAVALADLFECILLEPPRVATTALGLVADEDVDEDEEEEDDDDDGGGGGGGARIVLPFVVNVC